MFLQQTALKVLPTVPRALSEGSIDVTIGGESVTNLSRGHGRERDTLWHSRAKPQSQETQEQERVIMNKKFGIKRTRDPRGDLRAVPTRSPRPNSFPGPASTQRLGPGDCDAPALAGRRVRGRGCVSEVGLPAHLEGIPGTAPHPLIPAALPPRSPTPPALSGAQKHHGRLSVCKHFQQSFAPTIRRGHFAKLLDLSSLRPQHLPGPAEGKGEPGVSRSRAGGPAGQVNTL